MNLFNWNKNEPPARDAKSIREELLYAIRQKLASVEGGEGGHIRGLTLYLAPPPELRPEYEAAVYYGQEERLRQEVERIADNYALDLPAQWTLETEFTETLPPDATPVPGQPISLWIATAAKAAPANATALLLVLQGEAEQARYELRARDGRINIGREKNVQQRDGFLRVNAICFPPESSNEANKYVSRQHAHIRFDEAMGQFLLYADEGGVPPQNKVKVKGRADSQPVKLQSTGVPHLLRDGDQIMLGHSALLEFRTDQS
ncbi:FHA domain-containing protein [Flaviaesturariibacter amylovorans]|uniref:FHA domain-containing protein n=1 Tax=Flaviaesturariibacter amylovorans TaxID=1084520 RepID=A0ABP8GKB1_9BACT